jgi:hypothetical protein
VDTIPAKLAGLVTPPVGTDAPKKKMRVPTATEARKLSDILKREDEGPAYNRKLINGLCGGALPFNHVSADMAWIPNVNFMEAAAMIESARVPYYQLLNVETYIEFRSNFEKDHPDYENRCRIAASKFHDMIKRWGRDWEWEFQRKDYEMLKHGKGPVMLEDYPNWRFRALDAGAVKVPSESASNLNKRIPYVDIFVPYRVHELWAKIKDESAAKSAGWNIQNVKNAIMYAMKGANSSQSWDYYERILQGSDLSNSFTAGDIINCVIKLVVEDDDNQKITKVIYTENSFVTPDNNDDKDNHGFLFCDPSKYDSYGEAVIVFFHEIGDTGRWESVKGLGAKAYHYLTVKNQMNCRMLAAVEMSSGLTVEVKDTKSKDAMHLVQRGMVTYVPPGAKIVQGAQPAGFLDGPITTMRVLDNQMASNLGQSSARSLSREDGKGEVPTATQVNRQTSRDASLNQGQISIHFTPLDELVYQMFKRAATKGNTDPEAKRFQKECEEAGCPLEVIQNICYVRWSRLAGYGSAEMRDLSNQRMLESGAVAAMTPEGQQNFWRNFTGGVSGADKVNAYFPTQQLPGNNDWMAQVENSIIHQGIAPPVMGDDLIHCQSHLSDSEQTLAPIAQAVEAGQLDPGSLQSAYMYLQLMGPHVEEHIGRLQQDRYRRAEAKLFQDKLNQMVAFHGKLRGAIRDAQRQQKIAAQEQQQATTLGALDEAKLRSAQVEDAIKASKAQADILRKNSKAENDARLKTISTLNNITLTRAKATVPNGSN